MNTPKRAVAVTIAAALLVAECASKGADTTATVQVAKLAAAGVRTMRGSVWQGRYAAGGPQGCGVLTLPGRPDTTLPLLALPGNPMSSFVSFHRFARTLLARLRGLAPAGVPATIAMQVDFFF